MKKCMLITLSILMLLLLVLPGCASSTAPSGPSASESFTSVPSVPEVKPSDTDTVLPRSIEGECVILQDYANNDTSKSVSNDFLTALDKEASLQDKTGDRIKQFGKDLFILTAASTFEQGYLVAGYKLGDGESNRSNLYYFEGDKITWKAEDSDVWSLNYTVFKNHTIAYGDATGWDGKTIVNQSKVSAEFANGETVSSVFGNIRFHSENNRWPDGSVQTDGYILIANGLTWVKNIQFFGADGNIQDDWHSGNYRFCMFGSNSAYVWKDKPNEIWTTYRYTEMLNGSYLEIKNEISPITVNINRENIETQNFLLNETIGMEYVWRNNNNYVHAIEVKNISNIKINGLQKGDKVIWASLEKDDGNPITDYSSICSEKAPSNKGIYCLIIKHNGDYVLKHENMYYTIFIKLI